MRGRCEEVELQERTGGQTEYINLFRVSSESCAYFCDMVTTLSRRLMIVTMDSISGRLTGRPAVRSAGRKVDVAGEQSDEWCAPSAALIAATN